MNISLTDNLKSFVEKRIEERSFSSASEYMRDLVRRDKERFEEERFKALIEDGLESGPEGEWKDIRAGFLAESGVAVPTKTAERRVA